MWVVLLPLTSVWLLSVRLLSTFSLSLQFTSLTNRSLTLSLSSGWRTFTWGKNILIFNVSLRAEIKYRQFHLVSLRFNQLTRGSVWTQDTTCKGKCLKYFLSTRKICYWTIVCFFVFCNCLFLLDLLLNSTLKLSKNILRWKLIIIIELVHFCTFALILETLFSQINFEISH